MATKMKSLNPEKTSRRMLRFSVVQTSHEKHKTASERKSSVTKALAKTPSLKPADCLLLCESGPELDLLENLSDSELIVVIHTQNREAYKELFARYQKKLFAYIYHLVGNKEETEDILQNVFSKTYKNIEHFDTSRKFSSWIYRIAHNESVNFLKRKSKRYTISWDDVSTSKDKLDSASNEERPEEMMEHKEIIKEIDWAIEKIPEKYQRVLKLRYFEERSYEDMSKILKKPINTVGTLINRAKRKLSEVVDKETGSR